MEQLYPNRHDNIISIKYSFCNDIILSFYCYITDIYFYRLKRVNL